MMPPISPGISAGLPAMENARYIAKTGYMNLMVIKPTLSSTLNGECSMLINCPVILAVAIISPPITTTSTSVKICILDSLPVSFHSRAVEAIISRMNAAVITMNPE